MSFYIREQRYVADTTKFDLYFLIFFVCYDNQENHGTSIASRVGFGEEAILKKLAPGNYTVKFLYYGINHMPLPNPLDCVTYPMEFGIYPLQRLEAIPALAVIILPPFSPSLQSITMFYNDRTHAKMPCHPTTFKPLSHPRRRSNSST